MVHRHLVALETLYAYISDHYGQHTHVSATYDRAADYKKIISFARQRMNDPNRAPYNIITNSCKTFAKDAIAAGRK